jgi:hypothetical protein
MFYYLIYNNKDRKTDLYFNKMKRESIRVKLLIYKLEKQLNLKVI